MEKTVENFNLHFENNQNIRISSSIIINKKEQSNWLSSYTRKRKSYRYLHSRFNRKVVDEIF